MLPKSSKPRTAARLVLGLALAAWGVAHLTVARKPFRAQVPQRLAVAFPVSTDDILLGSRIIEIGLGAALSKERLRIGAAGSSIISHTDAPPSRRR